MNNLTDAAVRNLQDKLFVFHYLLFIKKNIV